MNEASARPSEPAVRRLLRYLRFLDDADTRVRTTVSSSELARVVGATASQVRHDFLFLGPLGKRGSGYSVERLRDSLRSALGLERRWRLCIIGAGQLGRAFLQYGGLAARGFDVVAIYDSEQSKIGAPLGGLIVRDIRQLREDSARERFDIALLVTPSTSAQAALDAVASAGIRGVLNFAPVPLKVPPKVALQAVDMTTELETIAFSLHSQSHIESVTPIKTFRRARRNG